MRKSIIIFCAALVVLAAVYSHHKKPRPRRFAPTQLHAVVQTADDTESPAQIDSCHHAVICGGIRSLEDLRAVIANDSLAASLYGGFDFSTARVTTLDSKVCAYIAYRVMDSTGDHIFYTRETRCIPKGEAVIQDAQGMTILMRCGNLIWLAPQAAIANTEPADIYPPAPLIVETAELIPDGPTPNFPIPVSYPAPTGTPSSPIPPIYPPVYPPCCFIGTPPKPPVSVPEPSGFSLLAVGLALVWIRWQFK